MPKEREMSTSTNTVFLELNLNIDFWWIVIIKRYISYNMK